MSIRFIPYGWMRHWAFYKIDLPPGDPRNKLPRISESMIMPDDEPLGPALMQGERRRYLWLCENFDKVRRDENGLCYYVDWPTKRYALRDLIDYALRRKYRKEFEDKKAAKNALKGNDPAGHDSHAA